VQSRARRCGLFRKRSVEHGFHGIFLHGMHSVALNWVVFFLPWVIKYMSESITIADRESIAVTMYCSRLHCLSNHCRFQVCAVFFYPLSSTKLLLLLLISYLNR
jgi:hypothetical protein